MISLPFFQEASARFSYQINLEGTIFTLFFDWNERNESWYMSILDGEGVNNILVGIRLVPGYSLLKQYRGTAGIPEGEFLIVDNQSDNDGVIEYDNIGVGARFVLIYSTQEEIEEG